MRELINEGKDVTRNTLSEKLGIVPSTAGRRFAPASSAGYIKEDPDNPNQKPKRYVLGDIDLPEDFEVIPSPERLRSCVGASGARGGGIRNRDRALEYFSDARSDASVHAPSDDSVVSEKQKPDRNRDMSEGHDNDGTATGVSRDGTHGRTMFSNSGHNAAEPDTMHASVHNIVRSDVVELYEQLRAFYPDLFFTKERVAEIVRPHLENYPDPISAFSYAAGGSGTGGWEETPARELLAA